MTPNDILLKQAFDSLKGQVQIGDVVAIFDDEIAYDLIDIVGSIGVCEAPGHSTKHYPVSELANVNLVKAEAVRLVREEVSNIFHNFN